MSLSRDLNTFRVNAKAFSLTFPHCTLSKEVLLQHLLQLSPTYCCVSRELHADGEPHLHAAITFNKRKDVRSQNFFDCEGFHPNIQPARNINQWITYVKKDGDHVEHGVSPAQLREHKKIDLSSVESEELFNFCINNRVGYGYYTEEKRRRNEVDTTVVSSIQEGTMSWYLQCLELPTTKTVVLTGATGIGKTTWALTRAPKPTLLVSHMDQLKKFKPGIHKSIVFDDMSFHHLPVTGQIHLTDNEQARAIHVRYGIVTLPAGLTKIFTCNEFPFTSHSAIDRRIKWIRGDSSIIEIQ